MARAIPRLGLFSVVAVGVNTIVGSGIFRLPAELARDLGPASLVAFAVGALLCAAVALAFAEAGGMFERGGGAYVYARAAFGPGVGFAVGWSAWVATVLTLATVAVAVPGQLAELWPAAGGPVAAKAIAVVLVVALGAVNLIGLRPAAFATNVFALAKVVPLLLFVAVGVFFVDWGNLAPLAPRGWGRTGPALLVVFFALSGFEAAAVPAGEAASAPPGRGRSPCSARCRWSACARPWRCAGRASWSRSPRTAFCPRAWRATTRAATPRSPPSSCPPPRPPPTRCSSTSAAWSTPPA